MERCEQVNTEKGIEDKPGIYMLYDRESNIFYVRRAKRLKERILQHVNSLKWQRLNSKFYTLWE